MKKNNNKEKYRFQKLSVYYGYLSHYKLYYTKSNEEMSPIPRNPSLDLALLYLWTL